MVAASTGAAGNGTAGEAAQVQTAGDIASRGITGTRDIFKLGAALIGDMLSADKGRRKAASGACTKVCRTGSMMLRAVDLEQSHNDGDNITME